MNDKMWMDAHTEAIVVPGTAGDITTDLEATNGLMYRVLYAEAWHDGAANRNLQWAVVATSAQTIGNVIVAVSGVRQLFYAALGGWSRPLVLHPGEILRINSDVIAGEHCNIVAIVEVIKGVIN